MIKTINKEKFIVFENEFNKIPHDEFNNLILLEHLGLFERLVSLLKELALLDEENQIEDLVQHLQTFQNQKINPQYFNLIPILTKECFIEHLV